MQHRKELLKKTFGDWKLTLNDDKREHITAANDPEERKSQRKMDRNGTNARSALHDQKRRLLAARKAWFKLLKKLPTWAISRKLEGQSAAAVCDFFFGCEVRGFSNREGREYMNRCGHGWSL